MPGPQPPPIKLTDRQRKMLAHLVRRTTTTQGLMRRASIVLAAAEGANNQQIADRLGFDRETVRLWRGRWLEARERLAAAEEADEKKLCRCIEDVLDDAPRSGGPPTFTPEQICSIVALACEDPRDSGRAVTHWTTPELAYPRQSNGASLRASPLVAWAVFWGEADLSSRIGCAIGCATNARPSRRSLIGKSGPSASTTLRRLSYTKKALTW